MLVPLIEAVAAIVSVTLVVKESVPLLAATVSVRVLLLTPVPPCAAVTTALSVRMVAEALGSVKVFSLDAGPENLVKPLAVPPFALPRDASDRTGPQSHREAGSRRPSDQCADRGYRGGDDCTGQCGSGDVGCRERGRSRHEAERDEGRSCISRLLDGWRRPRKPIMAAGSSRWLLGLRTLLSLCRIRKRSGPRLRCLRQWHSPKSQSLYRPRTARIAIRVHLVSRSCKRKAEPWPAFLCWLLASFTITSAVLAVFNEASVVVIAGVEVALEHLHSSA